MSHQNSSGNQTDKMSNPEERRPHVCPTCGKAYIKAAHLRDHQASAHERVRYICAKCQKPFVKESYRNRHQQQCSGTIYTCSHCHRDFTSLQELRSHRTSAHQPQVNNRRRPHPPEARPSTSRDESVASGYSPVAKRARSECVEVDPLQPRPEMLPQGDDELTAEVQQVYADHWSSIRTHRRTNQRVQDMYNFRIQDLNMNQLREQLMTMFRRQVNRFKINVSFGFILRNIENGELRYYHSSYNLGRMLEAPHVISNEEDFETFLQAIMEEDILEWARKQRPNTKWTVVFVTNATFYINHLPDHPIGCVKMQLPEYININKAIIGLVTDKHHSTYYQDNLCFFRALAIHQGASWDNNLQMTNAVRHLLSLVTTEDPGTFEGIQLKDLPDMEVKFEVNIMVFELKKKEDGQVVAHIVQRSHRRYADTLYLNLYENHFSLITNLDKYCKSYECRQCHKMWKGAWEMNRHERTCNQVTKKKYVGGSYQPEPTVFELLTDESIMVKEEDRYYPYRITYDFESYFLKEDLPRSSQKLTWEAKHVPLSVSVCSNVPGYTEPQCFVTEGNPQELVNKMVDYMHQIQETSQTYLHEQHSHYYNALCQLLQEKLHLEVSTEEEDVDMTDEMAEELKKRGKKTHPLEAVKLKYEQWMTEMPVVGFNSAKYDINMVKPHLVKALMEKDDIKFVVKKSNAFMCITTERLKFVDIRNYLAPGFDYATYLKAYKCTAMKGYFPYEWMDHLLKLKQTMLPSHQDFYSTLKNRNITEEEYSYCQDIWQKEDMTTMKDYLMWYNNRDVVPFLEALEKQFNFYCQLGVDMFKDGISVPGLTTKYLFKTTNSTFWLYDTKNSDLHDLVRENMVGGPSIIFHRYHEAEKTRLRENVYGEEAKICKAVVGYDANALYLWCLMQDMPTGPYVRRKAENGFKPHQPDVWGKTASEWMEWEASQIGKSIRHKYNGKEKCIGQRQLPVDGWCAQTNTVYQFHGCYWHGHECMQKKGVTMNEKNSPVTG